MLACVEWRNPATAVTRVALAEVAVQGCPPIPSVSQMVAAVSPLAFNPPGQGGLVGIELGGTTELAARP